MNNYLIPTYSTTLQVIGSDGDFSKERERLKILIVGDDMDFVDMLEICLAQSMI